MPIPLVAKIDLPPTVVQSYPKHSNPGPAPASATCPRPARADGLQKAVLGRVNGERKAAGLPALGDAGTMRAAATHAAIAAFVAPQTRAQLDALALAHDIPLHTLA